MHHVTKLAVNIFWFRRDLRLHDNTGLQEALKSNRPVVPVFIFDRDILDQLENKKDRRVEFIHNCLFTIQQELEKASSSLEVYFGYPLDAFKKLDEKYSIGGVYVNHDYEPYAIKRDKTIEEFLKGKGVQFLSFKDQVIFEKKEIVKKDGNPYTVFTPYSQRWLESLEEKPVKIHTTENLLNSLYKQDPVVIPSLDFMGFAKSNKAFPTKEINTNLIADYGNKRDIPSVDGTSHLGIHLRFGTVSVRQLVLQAKKLSPTFLNELIWREFFQSILWFFPAVGEGKCFKPQYELIRWRNSEKEFELWRKGMTGYPIVDAGMRELNETGFMHNRVRMITASFLAKHLLIDWRWGEAWFAEKLLDFELASNNGNWQWAAGCGCDAAPYFRIFNPALQTKKFDPELKYIKQWVSELNEFSYPRPIVDHELARKRCLEVYSKALNR
jgi:deoxyribodipyrimidine photo-lyase